MKTTFSTISQLMSCPYWLRFYIVVLGIAFLFFVTFFLLFPISIWTFNPLFCLDIYFPFPFGLLLPFSIWTFFPFFNSFLFQFFFFLFFQFHRGQSSWISSKFLRPILCYHGCVKSTVIERRQHQLGRMADFPTPVTFSVFDLQNREVPQIKSQMNLVMNLVNTTLSQKYGEP